MNVRVSLEYRELLEKAASERRIEEDYFEMGLSEKEREIPTENARKAQEVLNKAQYYITLDEMKMLEEQAQEKEKMEVLFSDLDGDQMEPTEKAKDAQRKLDSSEIFLSLVEYMELEAKSQEEELSEFANLFDDNSNVMMPTKEALRAKQIIEKSHLSISIEERKRLIEESKKKEVDNIALEFVDKPDEALVPTAKAKYAQNLLDISYTTLNYDEVKKLQEQSKKREKSPFEPLFDDDDGMVPTKEAQEAIDILNDTNTVVLLGKEEFAKSKENEQSKNNKKEDVEFDF